MTRTPQDTVCLVTGGSSGIGLALALGLARAGTSTGIVARDRSRGEQAIEYVREQTGNDRLELFLADLSVQSEVRQLAEDVQVRSPELHVLINNAGAIFDQRQVSADGIEMTWALNHLAPFLLTNLLLDRLKQSGPARVITLSSAAHQSGSINFDDPGLAQGYSGWRAYNQSKLANIMFTHELAGRTQDTGITANCYHPGVIRSGFGKNDRRFTKALFTLMSPFLGSPKAGADTGLYLALSPDDEHVTGKYFVKRREVQPSRGAFDTILCEQLWRISAEMVGMPKLVKVGVE